MSRRRRSYRRTFFEAFVDGFVYFITLQWLIGD